jgi:hypothetical protein
VQNSGAELMGIRDRPRAPHSPWQNGHTERLIGSIRRECLDHVVVFSEQHLRQILLLYMDYYNGARTHLALNKDAPLSRAIHATGAFFRCQFSADCTINMCGFNFRQGQPILQARALLKYTAQDPLSHYKRPPYARSQFAFKIKGGASSKGGN